MVSAHRQDFIPGLDRPRGRTGPNTQPPLRPASTGSRTPSAAGKCSRRKDRLRRYLWTAASGRAIVDLLRMGTKNKAEESRNGAAERLHRSTSSSSNDGLMYNVGMDQYHPLSKLSINYILSLPTRQLEIIPTIRQQANGFDRKRNIQSGIGSSARFLEAAGASRRSWGRNASCLMTRRAFQPKAALSQPRYGSDLHGRLNFGRRLTLAVCDLAGDRLARERGPTAAAVSQFRWSRWRLVGSNAK